MAELSPGMGNLSAPRNLARRMYFTAGSEDKHPHLYVTCCHINAKLYSFQNF